MKSTLNLLVLIKKFIWFRPANCDEEFLLGFFIFRFPEGFLRSENNLVIYLQ